MGNRRIYRAAAILIISVEALFCVMAADGQQPWYVGKKIAEFENEGLLNVEDEAIQDIQYEYVGKNYSDELFNELQGKLYATDEFSYFLADAERTGDGGNELKITMQFFELPYVSAVTLSGVTGLKEKDVREALTVKEGSFLQEQELDRSKDAVAELYRKKGYADVSVDASYTSDEASNKATLTYTVDEGKQQKIGEILFSGNEGMTTEQLRKQVSSKTTSFFNAGYYDQDMIESDRQALETYYRNNGYADATVTGVDAEPMESDDDEYERLQVTFHIDEGIQWLFGGIEVTGNTVFDDEELQQQVTTKIGDVLDEEKVTQDISKIADLYWNDGYIYNGMATKKVRDDEAHTISYVLEVQENGQATIEDIRLKGLNKTKPYVFLREMAFQVGDVFSKEKLIKSAQNIYNTLIVTDVETNVLNGSKEGTVIPEFTVTEGNQMDIQFGATFGGNVDGFPVSGFFQWSDKNLRGTGRDLSISTNLSPDSQSVSLSLSDGWVGDKRWSNGLSFSFSRTVKDSGLQSVGSDYYTGHEEEGDTPYPYGYGSYQDYLAADEALPSARYLMTYTLMRFSIAYSTGYTFMFDAGSLKLSGGLSIGLNKAEYDKDKYDPYEKLIYEYGRKWQFSNHINIGFTWDGRDLIENTSRGYVLSQQFTYAGGLLGGLSNYIRSSSRADGYLTLFTFQQDDKPANVVLGLSSAINIMLPQFYNGDDGWKWYAAKQGATRYEMLYIDGMNIGRGFDVVYDQSFLFDNQVSIGVPIVRNILAGEVYASATGVASQLSGLGSASNPIDWYFSIGAGVKLKVPGFPLGLYLVKNATYSDDAFSWEGGTIFKRGDSDESGLKLVLAITTSLY